MNKRERIIGQKGCRSPERPCITERALVFNSKEDLEPLQDLNTVETPDLVLKR